VCGFIKKKQCAPDVLSYTWQLESEILGDSEVHEALHGLTCFHKIDKGSDVIAPIVVLLIIIFLHNIILLSLKLPKIGMTFFLSIIEPKRLTDLCKSLVCAIT
jgi:hypothetical protein